MNTLILHNKPLASYDYDSWLEDVTGNVVLLAAKDQIANAEESVPQGNLGYTRIELLDTFEEEDLVVERAIELAREFQIEHVIALSEAVIIPAARVREKLGLGGAWLADVMPYRDKALMKEMVARFGVDVAAHIIPKNQEEIRQFAARHGFPLVFKERSGKNSVGLEILPDNEALENYLLTSAEHVISDEMLLEAYVEGRMCHVDGLVRSGKVAAAWPSQYQYSLASFGMDQGARVDLTLDPSDPLTPRLLKLTQEILAALRIDQGRLNDFAFHAEIFHTPEDRLVLCEIACRPGGAKVAESLAVVLGFNLRAYAVRAPLGLSLPQLEKTTESDQQPTPLSMAAQVLVMKRPGRVVSMPEVPLEPWIEHFWSYASTGQVLPFAAGSADFLAAAIVSAPNRIECEKRSRELGERFEAQIEILAES